MKSFRFKQLDSPAFDSRIKSDEVKGVERWVGFFLGPALVATIYCSVSGSYLNTFYTDVLHLGSVAGGLFLTLMPIVSKCLDAVTNIIMGRFVDNTKSRQGKARPWILISGPLMMIAAALMFMAPTSSTTLTVIWVTCTYSVYFCITYTMYNLSNVLTLPLSTRDVKQRDTLGMAQSMGINMVPGLILAVVFPSFILPYVGVDQSRWMMIMGGLSVLSCAGTLIQYYFTRERITEEERAEVSAAETGAEETVPLMAQVKGCLSSKYWVMIMIVLLTYQFCNNVAVNSLVYYANWVVGTYNDGTTLSLLNIIGQAMLGPGIVVMWPMVKKFGKQKVYIFCGVIAVAGCAMGLMMGQSLTGALIALTIRSIGFLPQTYVTLSVLADALDHVEWKCGYRCDGFSSSIYSIIFTVCNGLGIGFLNLTLSISGYVPPASDGSWVAQTAAVQNILTFNVFGMAGIGAVVLLVIFLFFDLEKKLPQIHEEIEARREKTVTE